MEGATYVSDICWNKPFDAEDLDRDDMDWWRSMEILNEVQKEATERGIPFPQSEMRRWEYAHVMTLLMANGQHLGDCRIVELGCDMSAFCVVLHELQFDVWAFDLNIGENLSNWCRELGIHVFRQDCLRLPVPDGFFNGVVSISLGEHIGDTSMRGWPFSDYDDKLLYSTRAMLGEAYRITQRGGLTAHTLDFSFPERYDGKRKGYTAEALRRLHEVSGWTPLGDVNYDWHGAQNTPEDQKETGYTAACFAATKG